MKIYKVKVNGKTYKVELESIDERVTKIKTEETKNEVVENKPIEHDSDNKSTGNKIIAPLQGTLLDIKVKVGDHIKKGDVVAIIEAMKLENEVSSPFEGEVVEISSNKGNNVITSDCLMVIK